MRVLSLPIARRVPTALSAGVLVLFSAGLSLAGGQGPVKPPPTYPTSADQIQNIDQVRTAIKNYYGDTVTTAVDPVPNEIDGADKTLHTFAADGAYVAEMTGLVADFTKAIDKDAKQAHFTGTPAILLDVDDTTLNTFSYEIYSNFAYNPTTNAYFVNACLTTGCVFPATPGMVGLVDEAVADGYTVFYLTGRPVAQHDGTVANLTAEGYPVTDANLYLKDNSASWLASCAPTCTTIQYKSLTRQHIESLGYEIVANFGDQYSDLSGGFADATFKLPNPMYYLP